MFIAKIVIVMLVVVLAALFDKHTAKIPNWLNFMGMGIGLCLSQSWAEVGIKLLGVVILYFYMMITTLGAGDKKLWLALCCIVGPFHSVIIFLIGEGIFFVRTLITNERETLNVTKLMFQELVQTKKFKVYEQSSYTFAPYICLSTIGYCVFEVTRWLLC